MAKNPLLQAQKSALAMNGKIGDMFAIAGTSTHPRGFVTTAYRNAKRAMRTALGEADPLLATQDVFNGLRATLRGGSLSLFLDAQEIGMDEAARQLRFYGIESNPNPSTKDRFTANAALDAILARLDAQEAAIRALILTEAEPALIVGDGEREGTLRPSDIAALVAAWAATLAAWSFTNWTTTNSRNVQFSKQALAVIDERTTDCCRQVNGQIQPMEKQFHLTGFPHYAEYMDSPPFHGYCRTATALYLPIYDDQVTIRING